MRMTTASNSKKLMMVPNEEGTPVNEKAAQKTAKSK
jgi:hypothetical protein